MPTLKVRPSLCPRCNGTGLELDPVSTGKNMRKLRLSSRISLHEMGRRLKLSAVYLWNLEQGRRRWTVDLRREYQEALGL